MNRKAAKITVFVLDSSPIVNRGIESLLEANFEFKFAGSYLCAKDIDAAFIRETPDILIMETDVGDSNAKEMTFYLQRNYPTIKIIVFTNLASIEYAKMIMRLGAAGFLLKNSSEAVILYALKTVYNGDFFIDETVKENILKKAMHRKLVGGEQKLTKREKEILQLLASNYNSQEISEKLFLSKKTIENHRSNMLLKFKVKNAASLIMKAIELGLLE